MPASEIELCYILRGVIVRVIPIPAVLTLERLTGLPIRVVDRATLGAAFGRVSRIRRLDEQLFDFGLVFDIRVQSIKRPRRVPCRVWQPVSNPL